MTGRKPALPRPQTPAPGPPTTGQNAGISDTGAHAGSSGFVDAVILEVKRQRGVDFSCHDRQRVRDEIVARAARLCPAGREGYLDLLRADRTERDRLVDALLVQVSSFFRNPIVFELIAQDVLPATLERKRRGRSREIRVWSAGCASGEEAYSVAILIRQAFSEACERWASLVFATDVSESALSSARRGIYDVDRLSEVKLGVLDACFTPAADGYMVRPFIRDTVMFSNDDLTSPDRAVPPESIYGAFDIVMCRNLLIYLDRACQDRVLDKLCRSLSPGGYLILGEAEGLAGAGRRGMTTVNGRNKIYQKRGRPT